MDMYFPKYDETQSLAKELFSKFQGFNNNKKPAFNHIRIKLWCCLASEWFCAHIWNISNFLQLHQYQSNCQSRGCNSWVDPI